MTTPNPAQNVAIVTGGSTGIGWEICRQMLAVGYEIVSFDCRKPTQTHERLHAVEVDLLDPAATAQAVERSITQADAMNLRTSIVSTALFGRSLPEIQ